jgi:glutaconate CoA-transferase subunit A
MVKIGSLSTLVAETIKPGIKIAFGGGAMFMKPMEVVREIIRQKIKGLHAITLIGDLDIDLLIGVGAIRSLHSAYIGLPMIGMARNFRRAIEKDHSLDFFEWTEMSMIRAYQAGAIGVPKIAIRSLLGSDLVKVRSDFVKVTIDDLPYVEVPALNPDIAIIHSYAADNNGNIYHPSKVVLEDFSTLPALCSKKLFASVEKIVSNAQGRELIEKGHLVMFSCLDVDFIVETPKGAFPTGFPPLYAGEIGHIMTYSGMSSYPEGFRAYLQEYVLNNSFKEE